jgi:O-succinylbenzoate synthase
MAGEGSPGTLSRRWRTIGTGRADSTDSTDRTNPTPVAAAAPDARVAGDAGDAGDAVRLITVGLWRIDLPMRAPIATAKGVHRRRPLVMVELVGDLDGSPVVGWGECAALADATYDREDADGSFRALEDSLVPGLFAMASRSGGRLPGPSQLGPIRGAAGPLAFAALEMAVADCHLRAGGTSLAALVGVEGRTVEVGAVTGQYDSVDELVSGAEAVAEAGIGRLKMKIGPGWDVVPVEAVRSAVPELRLQVDANGSYVEADGDHLAGLDRFELLCLEQPLAPTDPGEPTRPTNPGEPTRPADPTGLDAHARLARRLNTPICLDESLDSPATTFDALARGACSVVCVKPSRLGGLGAALQVIESCTASGVPLWMGGMFESGYARGVNTTLAALTGFSWPGDLRPAGSYLDQDLVAAPGLSRSGPGSVLRVELPKGPGLGDPPDRRILELSAVTRVTIDAPR